MLHFSRRVPLVAIFAALAIVPPASAQNSTLKIHESAFNKFATMVGPLQFSQRYALRFTIGTPWGPETITLCDSTVLANIINIRFDVAPSGITITGMGLGTWCGFPIIAPEVRMSATASYNASSRTVRVSVGNVTVSPHVLVPVPEWARILGLPRTLDVVLPPISNGASIAVPPIPDDTGLLHVEAPARAIAIPVRVQNVQLLRRNGYLELRSNVQVR